MAAATAVADFVEAPAAEGTIAAASAVEDFTAVVEASVAAATEAEEDTVRNWA